MSRDRARALQRLKFKDPRPFLVRLREIESVVATSNMPAKVKNLRTNSLRSARELREAALFCHGIAQRIGQTVYLAPHESQDFDFVASWLVDGMQHLAPVQLKEVVPHGSGASASIQKIVNRLTTKYVDSKDLTVAIHLNQASRFDPSTLVIPRLTIAALWVFASISQDQSVWGMWGNFLEKPEATRFEYPTYASKLSGTLSSS